MKIFVKVKAGAKENKVTPPAQKLWGKTNGENEYYLVSVKERPTQGRANDAVVKLLAKYFSVMISSVELKRGAISKIKTFEILGL